MSLRLLEQDFGSFFEAPFRCYPKESLYVSPMRSDLERFLDEKKNPLFRHFGKRTYYTALRDGLPVGRITAHIHEASNKAYSLKRDISAISTAPTTPRRRGCCWRGRSLVPQGGLRRDRRPFNLTAMQADGGADRGL